MEEELYVKLTFFFSSPLHISHGDHVMLVLLSGRKEEKGSVFHGSIDRRKREIAASKIYGTLPLPTIESLQWSTELPIHPVPTEAKNNGPTPTLDAPIHMSVSMTGSSVLEGLREMVKHGVAESTLPPYLVDIHSLSMNKGWIVRPTGIFTHAGKRRRLSSLNPNMDREHD